MNFTAVSSSMVAWEEEEDEDEDEVLLAWNTLLRFFTFTTTGSSVTWDYGLSYIVSQKIVSSLWWNSLDLTLSLVDLCDSMVDVVVSICFTISDCGSSHSSVTRANKFLAIILCCDNKYESINITLMQILWLVDGC